MLTFFLAGLRALTCWVAFSHRRRCAAGLWHHATLNLAETVAVAWRERFIQSPLDSAVEKWVGRVRSGGIVALTDEDGRPRDPEEEGSLVFDT